MKKKLILIIGLIVVLLLTVGSIILYFNHNNKKVEEVISLVQMQEEIIIETKGYTVDNPNIILNPYELSPLTAVIAFETEKEISPVVTVVGKDEKTTYIHEFESSKKHYLTIYGLYADHENEVIVTIDDEEYTFKIITEALPEDFQNVIDFESDEDKLTDDLYFITPSSGGYTSAYDANGDVRWYLTQYAGWKIDRLENGNLLLSTERLVHAPYYNTGLYEINMLGKIYTEFNLPGGYHHDYFELENGNIIVATDDFEEGTVEDYIVELDRNTGFPVKEIDLKDILNTKDSKSEYWTDYDWFHNNSVWYDKETNSLTLSGRHQDAVVNLDYDTNEINWIIGDSTNWSEEYQQYFFEPVGSNFEWQWAQHAAMILPNGNVFIFDNGNNKSKIEEEYVSADESYSRGVIYDIDTENMTIKQVYEYGKSRGSSYYSPYVSDVDYLKEDNYLLTSGGIILKDGEALNSPMDLPESTDLHTYITEIENDEIVYELKLDENVYRAEKMSLYANEEFTLEESKLLGGLEETEKTRSEFAVNLGTTSSDEILEKYNINIYKEYDRLVFEGDFTKENTVNLILHQGFTNHVYEVRISQTPYTALCVSIFGTDQEDDVIESYKYINKTSLSGNYDILIEIDGTLYDTDLVTNF